MKGSMEERRSKIMGGMNMGKTVRAKFSRGIIRPLEEVDLEEGKEITITIVEVPPRYKREAFRKSAGAWKGTIDAEKLIENIYGDRLLSTREEPRL
jgi:predicted DNA-binding antitoxin AbrB/MazE fold protein